MKWRKFFCITVPPTSSIPLAPPHHSDPPHLSPLSSAHLSALLCAKLERKARPCVSLFRGGWGGGSCGTACETWSVWAALWSPEVPSQPGGARSGTSPVTLLSLRFFCMSGGFVRGPPHGCHNEPPLLIKVFYSMSSRGIQRFVFLLLSFRLSEDCGANIPPTVSTTKRYETFKV